MLPGLRNVTGPLQRTRQNKFGRSVQRIDLQCVLKNRNGLVELLHFFIADSLKIEGIDISGIDCRSPLKAGQRGRQIVVRVLRQAKVIPRLSAVRIESDGLPEPLLGVV